MEANNGMGMGAQTLAPPPHHHPHQNPMLLPPPSITYPPPPQPPPPPPHAIEQHQPYDPSYNNLYHYHQQEQIDEFPNQNINTLFVSGLPDDIKPREIHNLFRRRHGFDFCQLKYTGRGNQVVAFATFFSHQAAIATLNTLNGTTFDPKTGASLHIELARSNSRPKRLRDGTGAYYVIDKRTKVSDDAHETSSNDGDDGSDEPSGTNKPESHNEGGFDAVESADKTVDPSNAGDKDSEQTEKALGGVLPPCSTLFIANLGPNCTEEELKGALSRYPGFHVVKMRANRGMPVAFADFEDADQATEALQGLQGSELPSSDRGGMHLEYARSKMRKT
ncbi:hypothetical protein AQUCO_02000477v1 [Aquilegia coerulea]|uniref:RRM domain-containing protein n=1 Tax=Aquilegia coerulea TaxID=218851 RepID=A0A2G5DHV8_AQUCA|nr:hypothetical protein AQUCO_02000477v1 [Aquilegia coerulea]